MSGYRGYKYLVAVCDHMWTETEVSHVLRKVCTKNHTFGRGTERMVAIADTPLTYSNHEPYVYAQENDVGNLENHRCLFTPISKGEMTLKGFAEANFFAQNMKKNGLCQQRLSSVGCFMDRELKCWHCSRSTDSYSSTRLRLLLIIICLWTPLLQPHE